MCHRVMQWLVVCTAVAVCGCSHADVSFSPDGKRLAFASGTGLVIVPAGGGAAWRVDHDGCQAPSWAPNGQWLAYYAFRGKATGKSVEWRGRTVVRDLARGRSTDLPGDVIPPYAWREDSKRLAAFCTHGQQYELVEYDADAPSEVLRALLPVLGSPDAAVWLPDTDDVAVLGASSTGADVFLVEAGEALKVTSSGDVIGLGLTADRRKLIWARHSRNAGYILMTVYTLDRKMRSAERAHVQTRVSLINPDPRRGPKRVERVVFSPDGDHIAVIVRYDMADTAKAAPGAVRSAAGAQAKKPVAKVPPVKHRTRLVCYTMRLDGSEARYRCATRLAEDDASVMSAAWSADGSRLAVGRVELGVSSVWVFRTEGGGGKRVAMERGK